jgi:prolyl oligopeptidase
MALILNPLPSSPAESVTEILHGVAITDPYRWLEDQDSSRTRAWLHEQTLYARAYLDAIPGRERIRERIKQLLAVEVISEPWKVGNRYFYLRRKAQDEQAAIVMREGDSCEEIVLVDPAERGEGTATAVNIVKIAQNGSILAYGVRQSGTDSQAVEFLDVSRRQRLPDRLPDSLGPSLVLSSDGLGFYYSHEISGSLRPDYRAVYAHRFGCQAEEDLEIFFGGEDANLHVGVFGSSDGNLLGYLVFRSDHPFAFDLYIQDLASGKPASRVVEQATSVFSPFFVGQELFALTDHKAPRRRIVKIDLDCIGPDNWSDIVPECQQRIEEFAVAGNWICVNYLENGAGGIEACVLNDGRRIRVPCPPNGTASLIHGPLETDTLFYEFSTFDQPTAIFSYHPASREHKLWAQPRVTFDRSSVELRQVHYKSKDGTEVPMYLVARKQRPSSAPLPTLLTGYGGFGYRHTAQFKASSAFLVEHNFILAIANVRGGGELGEEWHLAGKRHNRQNSFDDFIAAAEWLVDNGYTSPEKLAISGGSNAGLLTGAVLTQKPTLFAAVVCSGPLLDMLRYHRFDHADRWIGEYGSADNPGDFPYLLAYSPYHRVRDGVRYPSVMLVSGDADTRCNSMHARKMTARLQAASSSSRPILLNYRPTWGHMPVMPLTLRIDAVTDRLAFICHELDVNLLGGQHAISHIKGDSRIASL